MSQNNEQVKPELVNGYPLNTGQIIEVDNK